MKYFSSISEESSDEYMPREPQRNTVVMGRGRGDGRGGRRGQGRAGCRGQGRAGRGRDGGRGRVGGRGGARGRGQVREIDIEEASDSMEEGISEGEMADTASESGAGDEVDGKPVVGDLEVNVQDIDWVEPNLAMPDIPRFRA